MVVVVGGALTSLTVSHGNGNGNVDFRCDDLVPIDILGVYGLLRLLSD